MILGIILTILIGALVGWLAGILMKSKGGFWWNCLVGIVGSAIGTLIFRYAGLGGGLVVELVIDIAGSCILIVLLRMLKVLK